MTKKELIEITANQAGKNVNETTEIVDALIETIKSQVMVGKPITIRGFGTFELKKMASRKGRNIKTGEEVIVPERMVPFFKVSKNFDI